ncbi:hypothetical protein PT300_09265 [Enterobacteriaceae bacterium ESL0689]|nr:hypothetical protein [Enterobacteriaceae bacterium ESL0689]
MLYLSSYPGINIWPIRLFCHFGHATQARYVAENSAPDVAILTLGVATFKH